MFFGKKKTLQLNPDRLPRHIAIIMDGNGRWAAKRGLPRKAGHRAGAEALRKICRHAGKIGIGYLTVYAFSTENWKRSADEVDALMSLLLQYLKNAETELGGDRARIRVIGDRSSFSPEIQREMQRVERVTAQNDELTVVLALGYGGRDEIVRAARKLAAEVQAGSLQPSQIDEALFADSLYTAGIPDPDLLIRTSGELRLSNFLPWQTTYSEFYMTDTLWPDFDELQFEQAIAAFQKRERRFGGR